MFTLRFTDSWNEIVEVTFSTLAKAIKFAYTMHSYENVPVEIISTLTGEIVFALDENDVIHISSDVKYVI